MISIEHINGQNNETLDPDGVMAEAKLMELILLITPHGFGCQRDFFAETYLRQKCFVMSIDVKFVQDNQPLLRDLGTLLGFHFQMPLSVQGKLVRCRRRSFFDIAVDIRRGSPTHGYLAGYELSAENVHQLSVLMGFTHGFMSLDLESEIVCHYICCYVLGIEGALRWDVSDIGIKWPLRGNLTLTEKEVIATLRKNFESLFIFGKNS